MIRQFPYQDHPMLKSDLRGIETYSRHESKIKEMKLKSDLRGIETKRLKSVLHGFVKLKSDLRGIET